MCLVVLPAFSHGRHYMGPPTMQTQAIQTLHRNNSNANTTNITGPPCYNHTNITQTSHNITQTSHKYHRSAMLQSHKHHTTSHKHLTNITGPPCYKLCWSGGGAGGGKALLALNGSGVRKTWQVRVCVCVCVCACVRVCVSV